MFDPVVAILIEKLSDGNVRIREGARKGLEVLAGEFYTFDQIQPKKITTSRLK